MVLFDLKMVYDHVKDINGSTFFSMSETLSSTLDNINNGINSRIENLGLEDTWDDNISLEINGEIKSGLNDIILSFKDITTKIIDKTPTLVNDFKTCYEEYQNEINNLESAKGELRTLNSRDDLEDEDKEARVQRLNWKIGNIEKNEETLKNKANEILVNLSNLLSSIESETYNSTLEYESGISNVINGLLDEEIDWEQYEKIYNGKKAVARFADLVAANAKKMVEENRGKFGTGSDVVSVEDDDTSGDDETRKKIKRVDIDPGAHKKPDEEPEVAYTDDGTGVVEVNVKADESKSAVSETETKTSKAAEALGKFKDLVVANAKKIVDENRGNFGTSSEGVSTGNDNQNVDIDPGAHKKPDEEPEVAYTDDGTDVVEVSVKADESKSAVSETETKTSKAAEALGKFKDLVAANAKKIVDENRGNFETGSEGAPKGANPINTETSKPQTEITITNNTTGKTETIIVDLDSEEGRNALNTKYTEIRQNLGMSDADWNTPGDMATIYQGGDVDVVDPVRGESYTISSAVMQPSESQTALTIINNQTGKTETIFVNLNSEEGSNTLMQRYYDAMNDLGMSPAESYIPENMSVLYQGGTVDLIDQITGNSFTISTTTGDNKK